MSKHRSLKARNMADANRNVLKRYERIKLLKARGQWDSIKSMYKLPKTKAEL